MKKSHRISPVLVLLILAAQFLFSQSSETGTKQAAGAVESIKSLLFSDTSTSDTTFTGTGTNTGTNTGTGGTNTGTGGTGTSTGGTSTGTGGTGTGTGGTGTGTGGTGTGTGTGTGGTGTGTGGTGTGTGGTGTGTGGTGTGTGGTGTGGTSTGTGGTSIGTGGTGTGGTGTGTGGTGTGGTGTGTGGTGTGTGGTGTGGTGTGGTGTGGTGTGTGTGGTGTGTGGTGTGGTGTGSTGTGGTSTGTGGTGTGGTSTGTGGTSTGTGGTGTGITVTGSSGTGTSTGSTGASTGSTGTSSAGSGSIYRPGWSKERVLSYPKGSRPAPVTYLTETYYNDHINRFKAEGGAFMIVEKWIETSPYPAFAPRKFVMLKSDMDKVMAKYYLSGKVEDIEDALGYRRGDLKGLDAEIHTIYVDTIRFRFEFPDGNEVGANDLWEPGGKTSGGYRECVVIDKNNPSATITHNKTPEFLHSPYGYKELIYQTGWDNKRVREIPKGSRPLPPSYLFAKYVANHLNRFNTEGGAFMVVKRWIEDPASNFNAFPLRKFVMLRSDMDKVVARYQQTGEVTEIEDALGYTRGTLSGLEDDLYVFYLDKTKFIFELPTGNEVGANSLWEPEARTSGGFLECVVVDKTDPARPITHNKSILNLQNQFSYIKVSGEGSNCIYKPGWSRSRVLSIPKGSRPNPSVYLTESYITDHINRFKTEGGAFMIVEKWIKSSPYPAFAPRKFVMLRSDMDKVMTKYYQTGDIVDIENALGYRRGDLKGFDAEIHTIYVDTTRFRFELPDGNEIGANELWEPGGKTSGGYRECVVIDKNNPSATITHNKNPEFLHNPYEYKELIYKTNWDNKRVREIPKGSRPLPASYLFGKYVTNHLNRFNTEGGAFMVVKRWIEDTSNTFMAFPLRKFVMLRSDMDKVVAQYQQTGDVTEIEDALGYTRGTLTGLEDDLYVFYINKTKYLFELPTGNEIGANSLWEPEARTSGGFLECVVTDKADPTRPITHNKSIAHLQSQFSYIKVSGAGSNCIYKPGWSKSRVLAIPKGSRPDPSTYLTESYINNHLNKFKTEGGAFMIVEKWIETSPYPSFAPRKFVMLKSDMEKVMDKYYQSGNVIDIEDALGYKRGDLSNLDAEIHTIYVDSTRFRFELPNGNEIGANELWEPGGKTSGGYRECVLIDKVDPTRTIVHNKDPETLHNPYAYRELIYQPTWDNKRVREIPKGTRPNPPSYLITSYVQNHLNKFNIEGGAFMVVKRWVEDTTNTFMSFPLRKFVMLKSDMDKVVDKYRTTMNVQDIEDALGYTRGALAGLDDDLYVFYIDKTKYLFELPNGNEAGANSLWEPEARTSGGFLECVVVDPTDPNRPITHNKNIANLKSQFTWIKVKP